jgi:hypothetical protein
MKITESNPLIKTYIVYATRPPIGVTEEALKIIESNCDVIQCNECGSYHSPNEARYNLDYGYICVTCYDIRKEGR